MKWLPKLMGFDYEILYKKGSENKAADALSRIPTSAQLLHLALSAITSDYVQQIVDSCKSDVDLQKLVANLEMNPQSHKHYALLQGQLRRKGKLVVGNDEQLRQALLSYFHSDPSGGHSGVQATMKRVTGFCYWKKLRQQVKAFVANCRVCQANKPDLSAYPGLLQPLPIPQQVWSEISMDFIEGLPPSNGKTVLFVVVDRLSKYSHFIPLSHPFTAVQVAQVFLDNVYKLHGLPKVIVSVMRRKVYRF